MNDSKNVRILINADQACSAMNTNVSFVEKYQDTHCMANFDRSLCWLPVIKGETVQTDCPFSYCSSRPGCENVQQEYHIFKTCNDNGTWGSTDYEQCRVLASKHSECIVAFCNTCPNLEREVIISVTLTLSIVSVILLIAAIVLFSIFDSIQCRRLSIHKHLALAFVFRFSALAIWTIVQMTNFFNDCTMMKPAKIESLEWVCKVIIWCVMYFQVASFIWMLIEGAFLYSRFTVMAMRHSDAPWWFYLACGWGIPLVSVTLWTIIHSNNPETGYCWIPYSQGSDMWILAGTMGIAMIMNLIFLLAIVVILVQKLRTENSAESKKIWRTIKATLLLVPLLGISNMPLFYEPQFPTFQYLMTSTVLQHSQGIFISVLYCFLNSEIQGAVKRQLSKVPIEFFKPRTRFETERTYVPEARNGPSKNGVPMEELNGTKLKPEENGQITTNGTNQIYSVTTKSEDSL